MMKKLKNKLLMVIAAVCPLLSFNTIVAQNTYRGRSELDSLKQLMESSNVDTTKLTLRAEIGEKTPILRSGFWDSIAIDAHKYKLLKLEAGSLNNAGYVYKNQGNILKAIDNYEASLKIRQQLKDKKGIANSLNNLGYIYQFQNDTSKAIEYFKESLKLRAELSDHFGMGIAYNNLGSIYTDPAISLPYLEKSLKEYDLANDEQDKGTTLHNIGNIYLRQKDYDKALYYFMDGLRIREKYSMTEEIPLSLIKISDLHFKRGDIKRSKEYAVRGLALAKQNGTPMEIRDAATLMKKIFISEKNIPEAYAMLELEVLMRDSINNTETRKASVRSQLKYEYEKKAAADSVRTEKEKEVVAVQLKQEKTQRYALYGGLFLTIVFGIFIFNRFRITRRQKTVIEEQKKIVDEKQKEILDSIHYAKRIQRSLLPTEKYIHRIFSKRKI